MAPCGEVGALEHLAHVAGRGHCRPPRVARLSSSCSCPHLTSFSTAPPPCCLVSSLIRNSVSYSGQCFSSEAWGGRSANRGQCAQACRLPYGLVVNGVLQELGGSGGGRRNACPVPPRSRSSAPPFGPCLTQKHT